MDTINLKRKFRQHQASAAQRGIPFSMTFNEWLAVWGDKIDKRGCHKDELGMLRTMDRGGYEPNNVRLGTPHENASDRQAANPKHYAWQKSISGHSALPSSLYRKPRDRGDPEKWGIEFESAKLLPDYVPPEL